MKKSDAVAIYRVLSPMAVTKFSNEIQNALLGNYLKLHDLATAHDAALKAAVDKLKAEELADEELNAKVSAVILELFNEEIDIELTKVNRSQFLAEASKNNIEVTLGQIAVLSPMLE